MADTVNEADSDLTMLHGQEASGFDGALDGAGGEPSQLPTETPPVGEIIDPDQGELEPGSFTSFGPKITTQDEADEYIKGMVDDRAMWGSEQQGSRDLDLDIGRSLYESENSVRARNQSEAVKGLKAIGGGILQGGLIVLEEAGYVADIDTYTNLVSSTKDLSGNWWTNLMKETQEGLRQSEAFKIYEEEADTNSIASQIFKWSSVEAGLSSAVGFGITGLGAAKLITTLGAMKKFKQLATLTDATLGLPGGSARAFTGPLATSSTANYFMGQMMAADTYNVAMEHLESRIGTGPGMLTRFEAQKIANNEAQDVVGLNMALVATGYIKFGGIFKRNRTDVIIANPTLGWQAKELIKKGSPTAFAENVYQEMIQMEQIHDADVRGDTAFADEYTGDYWDRVVELMLSDRAVHAGALGVVGGPIQFALIQRPMMGKQLEQQKSDYTFQQGRITFGKELAANNFETFGKYNKAFEAAVKKGDLVDSKLVEDSHLIHEIVTQHTWGVLDMLRKDIETIRDAETGDPIVSSFEPGYKEKATEFLDLITLADEQRRVHNGVANLGGVIYNRLVSKSVDKAVKTSTADLKSNYSKLGEVIKTKYADKAVTIDGFTREEGRFKDLGKVATEKLKRAEAIEDRDFTAFVTNREEYLAIEKNLKSIKKYNNLSTKLGERYIHMLKPEVQAKWLKDQAKKTKDAPANLKESAEKTEEAETKKKTSGFVDYNAIRNNKISLTPQELLENNEAVDADIKKATAAGEYANLREGSTFSSVDPKGVVRNYSKFDIVQNQDGQLFQVMFQNRANSDSRFANMPVLKQVELIKGRYKLSGSLAVLPENNMLRNGVLQAIVKADGKPTGGHEKVWKSYRMIDTILKPNFSEFNEVRISNQAEGIVNTVNVHESSYGKEGFEWIEDYRLDLLAKPFAKPYEVTLKLNSDFKNNSFIDVLTEHNGEQIKLTRLNRNHNLAHEDLLKKLVAGEVITGKINSHYTYSGNLAKNRDSGGNQVHVPISEFNNINPDLLLNGSLVIAQTKGARGRDNVNAARAMDGTVYDSDHIEVNVDGEAVSMQIPYADMTPGDTYALVTGVGGKIMPLGLRATNIGNLPSTYGNESRAVDIMKEWEASVQDLMSEEIANEVHYDEIDRKAAEVTNEKKSYLSTQDMFRANKRSRLKEKSGKLADSEVTELWASFQDSILQHISYQSAEHIRGVKEDGTERFEMKGKKKLINPSLFKPTIVVTEGGKYAPGFQVHDENNLVRYKEVNSVDHQAEFLELLSGRRSKAPIDALIDTTTSMEAFVRETGITTDIDLNTIFVGASGQIQLIGDDIKYGESAAKSLKRVNNVIHKARYDKRVGFQKDASEATLKDFNSKIDNILKPDSVSINMEVISNTKGEVELVNKFITIGRSLNIGQPAKVEDIVRDIMENPSPDKTEELQSIEDALKTLKLDGYEDVGVLAKGVLAMRELQTKVKEGELTLMTVSKTTTDNKFVQAESMAILAPHTTMWHKVHGLGKVVSTNHKTRLISVSFKGKPGVNVYPADLYLNDGAFHRVSKLTKSIVAEGRKSKDSVKYKTLVQSLTKEEARASYLKRKAYGEPPKDTGSGEKSTNSISDVAKAISSSNLATAFSKFSGNSSRTDNITKGFDNYIEVQDKLMAMGGSDTISLEFIKEYNESWLEAVPYTDAELQAMMDLLQEKIDAGTDVDVNTQRLSQTEYFKDLVALVKSQPAPTTETSLIKSTYVPMLRKYIDVMTNIPSLVYKATPKKGERVNDVTRTKRVDLMDLSESESDLRLRLVDMIILETELYADRFKTGDTPQPSSKPASKNPGQSVGEATLAHTKSVLGGITSNFSNVKGLTEGGKVVGLENEFKWYVDQNVKDSNGDLVKFGRVTDLLGTKPNASAKLETSQLLGTKIDTLLRDYFDPSITTKYDEKYGVSEDTFTGFMTTLEVLKDSISGQTVLSSGIVLFDQVTKTAGTVDLITYNKAGEVFIYDVKTMLFDPGTSPKYDSTTVFKEVPGVMKADGSPTYKVVAGKSQDSSRTKHQKQLSSYRILLNNAYGILAQEEVYVVPIQVNYTTGDTSVSSAVVLPTIPMKGLDEVSVLKLDLAKSKPIKQDAKPGVKISRSGGVTVRPGNFRGLRRTTKPKVEPVVEPKAEPKKESPNQDNIDILVALDVPKGLADTVVSQASPEQFQNLVESLEMAQSLYTYNEDKITLDFLEANNMTPFKLASKSEEFNNKDFKVEVAQVKKLLPNVPINVVNNVSYMYKKYGVKALGAYDMGAMHVVKGSSQGTVFHEAFHAVADLYLTDSERSAMVKERGFDSWTLKLEEKLAEEFEEFQKSYTKATVFDKISRFFADIIDWVRGKRSTDVVKGVFSSIMDGGYAKSESKTWVESSLGGIQSQEAFESQLSEKNNVILQNLKSNDKIKIVC